MQVTHSIQFVDSDWTTHFRNAIAARDASLVPAASDYADIQIASGAPTGVGDPAKLIIKSIRLESIENANFRVEFYERTVPKATNAVIYGFGDGLLGAVDLTGPGDTAPSAYHATGYKTGTYFVRIVDGLEIPYWDKEGKGQLHVKLSNISTVAKSAGDVGALQLRVGTIQGC